MLQKKLDKELKEGRLKSAFKIFKTNLDLDFDYAKGLKIILENKESPLDFLEECKKINEIETPKKYTQDEYYDFLIGQKPFGEMLIIERFLKMLILSLLIHKMFQGLNLDSYL